MCTRLSFDLTKEKIRRQFNLPIKQDVEKSYNIGPTQYAYIFSAESPELLRFRWGLIPYWAKEPASGNHLIHAMAEGIEAKDSFRMPFRQRRCIIFVDSYYERLRKNQKEHNYRILLKDHSIMALAGIWDMWTDETGRDYYSFAIVTTQANEELRAMGWSRMPVMLNTEAEIAEWLDTETILYKVSKMLKPLAAGSLNFYPVSDDIDNPNNDYPELHKEIDLEAEG